eukprot:28772_5
MMDCISMRRSSQFQRIQVRRTGFCPTRDTSCGGGARVYFRCLLHLLCKCPHQTKLRSRTLSLTLLQRAVRPTSMHRFQAVSTLFRFGSMDVGFEKDCSQREFPTSCSLCRSSTPSSRRCPHSSDLQVHMLLSLYRRQLQTEETAPPSSTQQKGCSSFESLCTSTCRSEVPLPSRMSTLRRMCYLRTCILHSCDESGIFQSTSPTMFSRQCPMSKHHFQSRCLSCFLRSCWTQAWNSCCCILVVGWTVVDWVRPGRSSPGRHLRSLEIYLPELLLGECPQIHEARFQLRTRTSVAQTNMFRSHHRMKCTSQAAQLRGSTMVLQGGVDTEFRSLCVRPILQTHTAGCCRRLLRPLICRPPHSFSWPTCLRPGRIAIGRMLLCRSHCVRHKHRILRVCATRPAADLV